MKRKTLIRIPANSRSMRLEKRKNVVWKIFDSERFALLRLASLPTSFFPAWHKHTSATYIVEHDVTTIWFPQTFFSLLFCSCAHIYLSCWVTWPSNLLLHIEKERNGEKQHHTKNKWWRCMWRENIVDVFTITVRWIGKGEEKRREEKNSISFDIILVWFGVLDS